MKSPLFLIAFALLVLSSCTKDPEFEPTPDTKDLAIQIKNLSDYNFTDLFISTGGGEFNYGDLSSTEVSEQALFDHAYRYCYVSLKVEEDNFVLQPIDYVGEGVINAGEIIYEIDVIDYPTRSLSIRIQE